MTNKGKGAGGKNTNLYGKQFEHLTDCQKYLIDKQYIKCTKPYCKDKYYLKYNNDDIEIIHLTQGLFKIYVKENYNISLFRNPDDAFIITNKKSDKIIIKILEKKEQRVEGSVETKLWAGPGLKREYEIMFGDKFIIDYAFTFNSFLMNKLESNDIKYKVLNQILQENKINIFNGNTKDYYDKLNFWINMI